MKIAGVIAEFNPFHNGHEYLLKKIKNEFNPDLLVVVLSSYFTMRGELSIHSPFLKAKYALNNADLIISLPFYEAINSADKFAENAVLELSKVGVTDLFFGSEENEANLFNKWDTIFKENQTKIKESLNEGLSYKASTSSILDIKPNDLLGYAYYKAIKKHSLAMNIHLIKRLGSNHGELVPGDKTFSSSSAIRNDLSLINSYCPKYVLKEALDFELLFPYFKYLILSHNRSDFKNLAFLSEGIENLIIKNTVKAKSFKELISLATTKRYTKSRIRRSILYMLFMVPKITTSYDLTRVLGYNQSGKEYLNKIKKQIKLATNIKDGLNPILDIELKIAKILDLVYGTNNLSLEQQGPILWEESND